MKFAAHTMSTPHLDPFEAVKLYASVGFDGIDLICDDAYPCAVSLDTPPEELSKFRAHAESYGLTVANVTPYLRSINANDESLRRRHVDGLKRCIELAQRLGAGSIRIWAGDEPAQDEWEDAFKRLVDSLRELGEFARGSGVALNVENHLGSMAITSEQTVRIVEAVGLDTVGILYDPANLFVNGDLDSRAAFERQKHYIGHVHVKNVVTFGRFKYLPTLLDEGVAPWAEIVRGLKDIGYSKFLSVEYEKRWHPELLPESTIGLRHELATLKRFVAEAAA